MLGLGVAIPEVTRRRGLHAATSALAARMSTPPSVARLSLIDNAVRLLNTAGVWPKLAALYVMAAHDAQAARLNWIGVGSDLTANGGPVFTTDRGYTGDGAAAWLDTGWPPSLGAQNSLFLSAWSLSNWASANALAGTATVSSVMIMPRNPSDLAVCRANSATALSAAVTDGSGHFAVNRSGASAMELYRNGVLIGTSTAASSAPSTATIGLLKCNGVFSSRQIAAAAIGSSLNAAEHEALHAALRAYLTAIGAA